MKKEELRNKVIKIMADIVPIGLVAVFCILAFLWRKNYILQPQTIAFVNLLAGIVLFGILFKSIRKHSLNLWSVVGLLSPLFFFNKLYDRTVFYEVFHIDAVIAWKIIGSIGLLVLFARTELSRNIGTKIIEFMNSIIGIWISNEQSEKTEKEEMKKQNKSKPENADRIDSERTGSSYTVATDDTIKSSETKITKVKEKILFNFISVVMAIAVTFFFVYFFISDFQNIVNHFTVENLISVCVSIAIVVLLIICILGILIATFVKWVQIIVSCINKEGRREWLYVVIAIGLFIGSQYFYDNTSFTQDDLTDLLVNGDLFTFPLVLSILIPIFLIFAENIFKVIFDNEEIRNILRECKEMTIDIAGSTVKSLLQFIQFATSDFLSDIIELSKDSVLADGDAENVQDEQSGEKNT